MFPMDNHSNIITLITEFPVSVLHEVYALTVSFNINLIKGAAWVF